MAETGLKVSTHFELLGLPVKFAIDAGRLEQNYLERSRLLHPDFHQQNSSSEQQASTSISARLNDAYNILKSPTRRADYLLQILGGPGANEVGDMPKAFLNEMLDLRMEIEEIRENSKSADSANLEKMEGKLIGRNNHLIEELHHLFSKLENAEPTDPGNKGILVNIRQNLNSARYIQGLLRDLRAD